MRHNYKGRKLGTSPAHTRAMKRSLVKSLLYNDRIKTIESRAKEIRPDVDRIITWAKKGDLHSRRLAIARLGGDKELVREVFEKVSQGLFADRQGGYTRIIKLGFRKGDNAPMVIMELCTEPVQKKDAKAADKPKPKRVAPKKVESGKDSAASVKDKGTEPIEAQAPADEKADGKPTEETAPAEAAKAVEAAADTPDADDKPAVETGEVGEAAADAQGGASDEQAAEGKAE